MELLHHTLVMLPGQDLTDAYHSNVYNLYYFFEHYFYYLFIPFVVFCSYHALGYTYIIFKQGFGADILGWLNLYTARANLWANEIKQVYCLIT